MYNHVSQDGTKWHCMQNVNGLLHDDTAYILGTRDAAEDV